MEKKTMGSFIAVLRKANGMTQRELAEKLNVSDKAVSRWERDECAPDLSLIPVIADIFGVTADELLRGERISDSRRSDASQGENSDRTESGGEGFSPKSKKQIAEIVRIAVTKHNAVMVLIAVLSLLGPASALLFNSIDIPFLGLFISLVIYVVAAAVIASTTINALSKVPSGDDFDAGEMNRFKRDIAYSTWAAASVVVIVIFAQAGYYTGGTIVLSVLFGALVCAVARFIMTAAFIKNGVIEPTNPTAVNRGLFKKCVAVAAVLVVITIAVQVSVVGYIDINMVFVEGTEFTNYDDFKEYMENPVDMDGFAYDGDDELASDSDLSDGEYSVESITDDDDNVLVTYVERNLSVAHIKYSESADKLPITVYTSSDVATNSAALAWVRAAFLLLCLAEIGACMGVYRSLRNKKRVK